MRLSEAVHLSSQTYYNLLGHIMLAENVTLDHTRLGGLGDFCHSVGKDCVAVVYTAVLGQESDQPLPKSKPQSSSKGHHT